MKYTSTKDVFTSNLKEAKAAHKRYIQQCEMYGFKIVRVHSVEYFERAVFPDETTEEYMLHARYSHWEPKQLHDILLDYENINSVSYILECSFPNDTVFQASGYIPIEKCFAASSFIAKSQVSLDLKEVVESFTNKQVSHD